MLIWPRRFAGALVICILAAIVLGAGAAHASAAASATESVLAQKYAPVLRFKQQIVACGGGEAYRPLDVSVPMSNDLVSLRGPWTSQPVVAITPSVRRLSRGLAGYSLDFPGDALDRNLVGGRADVDEDEIDEGQHEAMAEMQKAAEELGANAIVGVSLDVEGVGSNGSMLLVTVSGTAVVVASG